MNHFQRFSSSVIHFQFLWGVLLCLYTIQYTSAQWVGVPLGGSSPSSPVFQNTRLKATSLPFFDDFSLATQGRLDPSLWIPGGGTYLNNTSTIGHPTLNVVTFDGASSSGLPYNFTNQNAQGSGDTLTSQPIDLSGLTLADSVYLSFFWQARGLGELPDADDSLRVQFLDNQGRWRTVWKQKGGITDLNFNYAQIIIRNPAFLHEAFQMRWQVFARLSGKFDTWHIDYVYLNKGRRSADRFVRDIAFRLPVTSFLKRYAAMPIRQYLARPEAETADSISTDVRNLFNVFNFTTFSYSLRDKVTGRLLQTIDNPSSQLIGSLSSQPKVVKPKPVVFDDAPKKVILESHFQIQTTDNVNPSIPGIDLRRNDSISGTTVLEDYYAYDDGTAEYAVYMDRPLARTAVRFFINQPDVVSAVRLNIVPILRDLTGQPITIQIWNNANGRPRSLLHQRSFRISYASEPNGFIEFPFDFGVAVRDTFYVAWQQIGQDGIPIGLDRNNQRQDQIFVNLGQEWVPYTAFQNDPNLAFFRGSLLLRPVIGGKPEAPITAVEPKERNEFEIFPNPTTGVVHWQHDHIRKVEIYDLRGTVLKSHRLENAEKSINLDQLPDGLYLLKLSDGQQTVTKKVFLRK
ncbi:MAG: T9SS type A sorting domain-containing protein [Runella sp.]